jgi:hypothetical protein
LIEAAAEDMSWSAGSPRGSSGPSEWSPIFTNITTDAIELARGGCYPAADTDGGPNDLSATWKSAIGSLTRRYGA